MSSEKRRSIPDLAYMADQIADDIKGPRRKPPYIFGEYQAENIPEPEWVGEWMTEMAGEGWPTDRTMFRKILNTRLPDDLTPDQYQTMIGTMETFIANSPYNTEVYQEPYVDAIGANLERPEYLSERINHHTGNLLSTLYDFTTEYLPNIPVRVGQGLLERTEYHLNNYLLKYKEAKLKIEDPNFPYTPLSKSLVYGEETTASDLVKNFDLKGKTAIVTGGTSGIGAEITRALASQGATVIVPTTRLLPCENMIQDMRLEFNNRNLHCQACDLGDMLSVASFLDILKESQIRPDILINNAAKLKPFFTSSHKDVANAAIGVNLLGHMALTDGVIEMMRSADPVGMFDKRIVNVTCSAHEWAALNSEELNPDGIGNLSGVRAYNVSKLGNIAHAQYTARWLQRELVNGITVNSVDPGPTTGTSLHDRTFFSWIYTRLGAAIGWKNVKTPNQSAAYILRLALDPDFQSVSGTHHYRYEMTQSPLSSKPVEWNVRFMNAIEELKQIAFDKCEVTSIVRKAQIEDQIEIKKLSKVSKPIRDWYIKQSERFEKTLPLPDPEMAPDGLIHFRPPPPHEKIGSKPLGIGPPDAPLIGDDLRYGWHNITDTYPVMIQELIRRRNLEAPRPSAEEQKAIDQTKIEFEALKRQIMYERQLKSEYTTAFAEPLPRPARESWWGWFKEKADHLTKPTIHK